jgi:hypothetical protein
MKIENTIISSTIFQVFADVEKPPKAIAEFDRITEAASNHLFPVLSVPALCLAQGWIAQ